MLSKLLNSRRLVAELSTFDRKIHHVFVDKCSSSFIRINSNKLEECAAFLTYRQNAPKQRLKREGCEPKGEGEAHFQQFHEYMRLFWRDFAAMHINIHFVRRAVSAFPGTAAPSRLHSAHIAIFWCYYVSFISSSHLSISYYGDFVSKTRFRPVYFTWKCFSNRNWKKKHLNNNIICNFIIFYNYKYRTT